MSVISYIEPKHIWPFFQRNKQRLQTEQVLIAENEKTEYSLYLTAEEGLPTFLVYHCNDTECVHKEGAVDEQDCFDTVTKCCAEYLLPSASSKEEQVELIADREWELFVAMDDFLTTVTRGDDCHYCSGFVDTYGGDAVQEILDDVLQRLAEGYCLPIYRPTMKDDGAGGVTMDDYPYNNPEDFDGDAM